MSLAVFPGEAPKYLDGDLPPDTETELECLLDARPYPMGWGGPFSHEERDILEGLDGLRVVVVEAGGLFCTVRELEPEFRSAPFFVVEQGDPAWHFVGRWEPSSWVY